MSTITSSPSRAVKVGKTNNMLSVIESKRRPPRRQLQSTLWAPSYLLTLQICLLLLLVLRLQHSRWPTATCSLINSTRFTFTDASHQQQQQRQPPAASSSAQLNDQQQLQVNSSVLFASGLARDAHIERADYEEDNDDDDKENEDDRDQEVRIERRDTEAQHLHQQQPPKTSISDMQQSNCSDEAFEEFEEQERSGLGGKRAQMLSLLRAHYRLDGSSFSSYSSSTTRRASKVARPGSGSGSSGGGGLSNNNPSQLGPAKPTGQQQPQEAATMAAKLLPELPRPINVSVLIISWYPPILKLSWRLNELSEQDRRKLDFYEQRASTNSSSSSSSVSANSDNSGAFDLELALDRQTALEVQPPAAVGGKSAPLQPPAAAADPEETLLEELRQRRLLVSESLSCFQVTYNIINSRFKITEEYPPYLRSIMLERLLPATEYSLHVVAVYLDRYRQFSERVQFVSPTDNESRRFKEGAYRPIHRYPDERPRDARIGLAAVRSEELTIVAIALLFWLATICLFINKWGKIRMLEPYQPAYREVTVPDSFDVGGAAGQAPLHQLPASLAGSGSGGSGPLAGLGAKVSGICSNLAAPGLVGVGVARPTAFLPPEMGPLLRSHSNSITLNNSAAAAGLIGKQQPLVSQQTANGAGETTGPLVAAALPTADKLRAEQHRQRSSESALVAGGGRKVVGANRGLLLRSRKRFETLADDHVVQRSQAELTYLFQSKAQALARATSMWTRQQVVQQQQKQRLKQQIASTHFNFDPATGKPDEFELLRRTSQVSSSLLRYQKQQQQRALFAKSTNTNNNTSTHLSPVPASVDATLAAAVAANTTHQLNESANQADQPGQQYQENNQQETSAARGEAGSACTEQLAAAMIRESSRSQEAQSSAMPPASESNKMRRLLFMSKTLQHHHVATCSLSSSTLINADHLAATGASTMGQGNSLHTTAGRRQSSSFRINSHSLDNETASQVNNSMSVVGQRRRRMCDTANSNSASWSSLPSAVARRVGRTSTMVATGDLEAWSEQQTPVSASSGSRRSHRQLLRPQPQLDGLVEHHILIEPPSPPTSSQSSCSTRRDSGPGGDLCECGERHLAGGSSSSRQQTPQPQQMDDSLEQVVGTVEGGDESQQELTRRLLTPDRYHSSGCLLWQRQERRSSDQSATSGEHPLVQHRPSSTDNNHQQSNNNSGCVTNPANSSTNKSTFCHQHHQLSGSDLQPESAFLQRAPKRSSSGNEPFVKLASYARRSSSSVIRCPHHHHQTAVVPMDPQPQQHHHHHHSSNLRCCGDYLRHQSLCAATTDSQQQQIVGGASTTKLHLVGCVCNNRQSCEAPDCHRQQRPLLGAGQTGRTVDSDDASVDRSSLAATGRGRISSVFVASPYSRAHRDSFAMLRALSQKKSKSAEDVAYLSSLVLQIWVRDRNPLLQSVSHQPTRRKSHGANERSGERNHT